mmetsp:Transcript_8970/g.37054  ORF Transcript_8970/g.37054 Transcript_8970/m.37054 type:complete len:115 (+) Transcript_8970:1556-1900(+)
MTCYEIITRDRPWLGLTEVQIVHRVVYEQQRPDLPVNTLPLFADLVPVCWSHDPNDRPSFAELIDSYFSSAPGMWNRYFSSALRIGAGALGSDGERWTFAGDSIAYRSLLQEEA